MAAADPIWTRTKQPWITFAEGCDDLVPVSGR